LIDHAKRGGGADNITCMMLRVVEAPSIAEMEVPAAEI
jgi:serine/threonine protein phosphatase PrpC